MLVELEILSERLSVRLQRSGLKGRTVTVKFKFHDFTINTRSFSLPELINTKEIILQTVESILDKAPVEDKKVRLLGVGISHFDMLSNADQKEEKQLKLF